MKVITKHTPLRIVEAVVLLALLGVLLIQIPAVQRKIAAKALDRLSGSLGGVMTTSELSFLPFNTLIVKDALILDKNPLNTSFFEPQDTLFYARNITVRFSLAGLLTKQGMSLRKAAVSDAFLDLVVEGRQKNNLKRIINGDGPKPLNEEMAMISIRKIDVRNFRFKMLNVKGEEKEAHENGINWFDLDLLANAKATDFKIGMGGASGTVDSFSFKEKSGYSAEGHGGCVFRNGAAQIFNFHLDDSCSEIELPYFRMRYNNYLDFQAFTDNVDLNVSLDKSRLDFRSLGYYAPKLWGKALRLDITSAQAAGTVNDLDIKSLTVRESDKGADVKLNGKIKDIEHFHDCSMDVYLHRFGFTSAQVQQFISGFSQSQKLNIAKYAPGEKFVLKGTARGNLDNLKVSAELNSGATGRLNADARIKGLGKKGRLQGDASIRTEDLDLGNILGIKAVHQCTMRSSLRAEMYGKDATIHLDTLAILRLNVLGYDYHRIAANGVLEGKNFDGRVVCADPGLSFLFQGKCNLSKEDKDALYRFYLNIGYADFEALKLDKRGTSKGSMAMNADFRRIGGKDMTGRVDIRNLMLENCEGKHDLGNVAITASSVMGEHRLNLESAFASALYSGTSPIKDIAKRLSAETLRRELPALFKDGSKEEDPGRINIGLKLGDASGLLSFIKPGLYVAKGTALDALMTEDGDFNGKLISQRIALGSNYIKDVLLRFDNSSGKLGCVLRSSELQAAKVKLLSNRVAIDAKNDGFSTTYSFDNKPSEQSWGEVQLRGAISRDEEGMTIGASTIPGEVMALGEPWSISPSDITWDGKTISVSSLSIASGEQRLSLDGGFSKTETDTLGVYMDKLDLGKLSDVFAFRTKIDGKASGKGRISSPLNTELGILAGVTIDSTHICHYPAGTFKIGSSWDSENRKIDLFARNQMEGRESVLAKGAYYPQSKKLNAKVKLDSTEVGYLSGILKGLFSEMTGTLSGDVSVAGPLNKLSVYSRGARIDGADLTLGFTNVTYHVSGPLHVDNNGLMFDDIAVRDSERGKGLISGGLMFDHLKNPTLDTHIKMDRVQAFNVSEAQSEGRPFFGKLGASGNIDAYGPLGDILLILKLRTAGTGNFHIPISAGKTSGKDLLTFTEKKVTNWIDPYELLMMSSANTRKKDNVLNVKLDMSVTPEVECFLTMDQQTGIAIKGHGQGDFKVDYSTQDKKNFTIDGDYALNDGNFHFAALGLVNKDFSIQSGSSIKFKGALMDSDLDINARYTTKASLATLVADSTSTSRRLVECGLSVTDKLRNPSLGFSVDIPDLEPTMKSMVQSALNTDDKIQKQFLALLVTNNFIPDDQSGIVNNSSLLYSNVAEIMAGQLNNILQKLEIPLDLGFKYQPNDGGTDIFDVAVSTQLFNNRVLVNGSVGNHKYAAGGTTNDMAGDLDIEVKLDKRGEVRLNLFSHSADQYTNYLDNTQRNGVGVGYQKEFNTFPELFKDIFTSRKEKAAQAERNAAVPKETVTINIEKDDE